MIFNRTESQVNWDNYITGYIVNWLNLNNYGEFTLNTYDENVYDNVEGHYLTYTEIRQMGQEYGFNLTDYLNNHTDVNTNYIGRVD